jgi:hypothetical protein
MKIKSTIIALTMASCICFFSCSSPSKESTATYDIGLTESKKITLPIDENTYFLSKSIFQFEEDGKEYLHFQNSEKKQYEIIIYDINSSIISKRIPLHKQGPNGIPNLMGSKPFNGGNDFLLFQSNVGRITILNNEGEIRHNYTIKTPNGHFMAFLPCSYFFTNPYMIDSTIYVAPKVGKPNMKKEDWGKTPMFFSLNLKTGNTDFAPIYYPNIFDKDVKRLADGAAFSYDYNPDQNYLVCSFVDYDSLMVINSTYNVKWYHAKSHYLKSKKPQLIEVGEGLESIIEMSQKGHYFHIMYDKYRNVYYRFVEFPCELAKDEGYMDEPKAREFSVIILDKDFQIIGETKFPGNKYFIRMSFVGRDGLYISENNMANPDFDEDKLVFACFALEDLKGK